MVNRLRILRNARGLTQEALGDRVGVAHSTIQRWENGKRKLNEKTIDDLCRALACEVWELFCDSPIEALSGDERMALEYLKRMTPDKRAAWFSVGSALSERPSRNPAENG